MFKFSAIFLAVAFITGVISSPINLQGGRLEETSSEAGEVQQMKRQWDSVGISSADRFGRDRDRGDFVGLAILGGKLRLYDLYRALGVHRLKILHNIKCDNHARDFNWDLGARRRLSVGAEWWWRSELSVVVVISYLDAGSLVRKAKQEKQESILFELSEVMRQPDGMIPEQSSINPRELSGLKSLNGIMLTRGR
ncbi:hypothetical protein GALMADRAFT_216490 [Galerina marginata CBS 339.88]|uniref:Uncharacterized protein n=1 Tax=Galerina marginata (strain CBS 339.88) TaxID=685588 RepID=A0A067S991_GALM3|nr:hypothetical protein GALMADRAFT_216490 [Galerina marginata CBS 339.88]